MDKVKFEKEFTEQDFQALMDFASANQPLPQFIMRRKDAEKLGLKNGDKVKADGQLGRIMFLHPAAEPDKEEFWTFTVMKWC